MAKVCITSSWRKGDKISHLHSVRDGKEVKFYFTNWNPLPVKGCFNSTYSILRDWLIADGWQPVPVNHRIVLVLEGKGCL